MKSEMTEIPMGLLAAQQTEWEWSTDGTAQEAALRLQMCVPNNVMMDSSQSVNNEKMAML
jgi:hypothetical protein